LRRRFFIEAFDGDRAELSGEAAHHLGRVLRAEPGQLYELSDGSRVRLGRIEFAGKDRVEFSLLEEVPSRVSSLDKTLLLAVVKFDLFEWAIEKATELGVNRIVPLAAARSEKGLLAGTEKRAERWRKLLFEASQQSRRVKLPVLEALQRPAEVFAECEAELKLMLSERTRSGSVAQGLVGKSIKSIALAVGPEGGWTEEEFTAATRWGFAEVSLGNLILRTETAVTAGLAVVNAFLESDSEDARDE
jgi:16S rRNA (uracil1498-N3)-methyltransferase